MRDFKLPVKMASETPKCLKKCKDFMVLELVMASKRHLKPSIRRVKMMKKQWFFKVFKVLHDFDVILYDVSQGENMSLAIVI